MSYSFAVSGVNSQGNLKLVHGTFTSATGDSSGTLDSSIHGLNYVANHKISLNGISTEMPKVVISSGSVAFTFQDTLGLSGKFSLLGR